MESLESFFTDLLSIEAPFSIKKVEKSLNENGQVENIVFEIEVDQAYRPNKNSIAHDHYERTWQHLNLFEYPCFIKCNVPVFKNKLTSKTKALEVPWARPNSGFTLLFEKHLLIHLKLTNCFTATASYFKIYPQRVRNVYDHYTLEDYQKREVEVAEQTGLDETSTKKGHNYISVFVNMETGKVIDIQDGKSSQAIQLFAKALKESGQKIEEIKDFSIDMSPAFISGLKKYFPNANITFDRFHVVKLINKYFENLLKKKSVNKELVEYHLNELNFIWQFNTTIEAAAFLTYWIDRTEHLFNMKTLVRSLNKHFEGIIQFADSKLTNGLLEGMNSKIQFIKRAARGYRNIENFKRMILFAFNSL